MAKDNVKNILESDKKLIQGWYDYYTPNFEYYNRMRNFTFKTSLSDADINMAKKLGRPTLEANIGEAYLSRLLGEFSKQEPSVEVRAGNSSQDSNPQVPQIVEGYMRGIFYDSNRDNMLYDIYEDCLSGSFSGMKIYTAYQHEMSFNQDILMKRVFDPTLIGFDKFARESHKGDGNYCYELFPYSKEDFESEFGTKYTKNMKFTRDLAGFNWSYCNDTQDILLVADFYKKKKVPAIIVQLLDGRVLTEDEYEKELARYNSTPELLIKPAVIGKPRKTEIINIVRHRITENDILEVVETDFKYLPIIFFSGNAKLMRSDNNGAASELTRSYLHHAVDTQKLKNFAMMSLANHLENMMQSKFMAPVEAVPAQYLDAWLFPQKASTLLYNQFKDNDPSKRLDQPREIQMTPLPPEVMNTFMMCDQVTQSILGSYDAALGINKNQLSGDAIEAGGMHSNAAAEPFNVGYMKGLNQAAKIMLDLIPKYIIQPRTIPVRDISNKRQYIRVNDVGTPEIKYNSNDLNVRVEASANFELQRSQALQAIQGMMKTSPWLNEYIGSSEPGIEMLLGNYDIRGIDALKVGIKQFVQQKQQQMSMAQQSQQENNPIIIERQKLQQESQKNQMDAQLKAAELAIKDKIADNQTADILSKIDERAAKTTIEENKTQAENVRSAVDYAIKAADTHHGHSMDLLNLHHENERASKSAEMKNKNPSINQK